MSALLELSHVTKVFSTQDAVVTAVAAVSLAVRMGECVSLLGHAACGKSTLLALLAGTEAPTEGEVLVGAVGSGGAGPTRVLVPSSPSLLPSLTARQNVRLAVDEGGSTESRAERVERVERYLDLMGIGNVADERPAELDAATLQAAPQQFMAGSAPAAERVEAGIQHDRHVSYGRVSHERRAARETGGGAHRECRLGRRR